jgi:hypothetical protein
VQCSVWGFCLCRGQPPERPGWRGVEIGEHACVGEQEGGGGPASVPCVDSTGRDGDGIGWKKSAVESPPLPRRWTHLLCACCLPAATTWEGGTRDQAARGRLGAIERQVGRSAKPRSASLADDKPTAARLFVPT